MDAKLIEEIKKHKVLYAKGSIEYRNRKKRAEAWNLVSEVLNIPESACRSRWKSLRDRFVKEFNKSHLSSGNTSEIAERHWIHYANMHFLQEQVAPRKTTSSVAPLFSDTSDGNDKAAGLDTLHFEFCTVSSPFAVIEDQTLSSNETSSTSQRSRKRKTKKNEFGDFLKQMSSIAEKRFCAKTNEAPKEANKHLGFFLMVQDLFLKLSEETIDDCKIFFINYLHKQIKGSNEILDL